MSGKDTKGAWETYKASVFGVRQDQQVRQSVLPEGEEEVCGSVDAATLKASSVPAGADALWMVLPQFCCQRIHSDPITAPLNIERALKLSYPVLPTCQWEK